MCTVELIWLSKYCPN